MHSIGKAPNRLMLTAAAGGGLGLAFWVKREASDICAEPESRSGR